jgi:hypothetical protein
MFFLACPFVITKSSTIFFPSLYIGHNPKEELVKNEKKLKEAENRLNKLSCLLSSEFINKAPENVILENCKKLEEAEDTFDCLFATVSNLKTALNSWREASPEECEYIKNNVGDYELSQLGNYIFAEKNKDVYYE